MPAFDEIARSEYQALMKRGQDAERGAHLYWTAGALTAAVMLSWAMAATSSGLMIPVVFAIAVGFYGTFRSRQQVRWISSYIEEFCEGPGGPQWFTRVHRLQNQTAYRPVGDWLTVCLANAGVIVTVMLAWMYAEGSTRGDLMAGIVTACGVVFGFHSISETLRAAQTDAGAMWRQVSGELKEAPRAGRASAF